MIEVVFKDLKTTNEWQDDGIGILHQVAQHPIQGTHAPFCPHKTQRDKILAAERVDLCTPLNLPSLAQRGSE